MHSAAARLAQPHKNEFFSRRNSLCTSLGSRHCADSCFCHSVSRQCAGCCARIRRESSTPRFHMLLLKPQRWPSTCGGDERHLSRNKGLFSRVLLHLLLVRYCFPSAELDSKWYWETNYQNDTERLTPSIIFPFPTAGQQKMWCCLHFSRGCQLSVCSICSVSCRRRWLIWKCGGLATASCSLGIPAGLSHFKKLFGGCFYPALLPHSFSEHVVLFTKAKGLVGSFCHSMWPTACSSVRTKSLAGFFWRTCCIKNFCLDGLLHSEVWSQCVCLFTARLHTAKYKLQPTNQHQAHIVQSTVSSTKLQANVFETTGNLFYFGRNLSEPRETPAVVQRQDFLSHLRAIWTSS